MSKQSDFYGSVYSTAKELGATDTQAHLAASQASLETGYGQHVVGNNYFGVKASSSYTGPTVTANTSEGEDAVSNRMNQTFRAYDGLKASVANYMDVMANAFPDAWNATNIADAAKGLVSGKFGRYAKDINYPGKIQSIANKLGAQQKYAYAQNPENVPVPYGPEEDPYAYSLQAQAVDGLSGVVNPASTQTVAKSELSAPGEWGIINGVTPVLGPVAETWSAMAAADPVQTPTGGLLSAAPAQNSFADMAAAGPMGLLSTPSISQADISRALSNVTTRNEFDPSFTESMMGPSNPVVPTSVETTSYTQPTAVADVGTGINSPEHINGVQAQAERQLAAARAMQPGLSVPASGLLSANPPMEAAATVPSGLLSSYVAQPSVTPAEQAISSISPMSMPGMLQNIQSQLQTSQRQTLEAPNFQQALNPSLPAMDNPWAPNQIVADPSIKTPEQVQAEMDAMRSLASSPPMSAAQINGYQQAAKTMAQAGMLNIGQQPPTDLSGNLPTNFNVLSPALETVSVPDQPTVAEPAIEGPATTPAVSQQTQQAVTQQAATQSLGDKLKAAVNPGTAIGGILGGATLGPIGGILGALLGNTINQNGFSSLGQQTQPGGLLGVGPAAAYAAWSGNAAPGSYGIATDGSRINSQGGGWTTRTDANGVTTSTSPWGGGASWWGGDPNDPESYT
jgi:hypothetical protein